MNFKEQFPVLANCTYLNTANSGILSLDLLNWRHEHDITFAQQGSNFRWHKDAFLQGVKETIAGYVHADADYTFLVPNFSFGYNTVLEGLVKQQRFLLLQDDYPSVVYPVVSRGFEYYQIPLADDVEASLLQAIEMHKPTVLACSVVQYMSGAMVSPAFTKVIKERFPDLMIVMDGTQFCGTVQFDFLDSGIDVFIASGYKWLMGGYGNGFVVMRPEMAERLYVEEQKKPGPTEAFLQGRSPLSLSFEPGHQDTLVYGTLQRAVQYIQQLGPAWIEEKVRELSCQAREMFASRGLITGAALHQKQPGYLYTIPATEKLVTALDNANIVYTNRGKVLRMSFHFYNTGEELQLLADVMDSCL